MIEQARKEKADRIILNFEDVLKERMSFSIGYPSNLDSDLGSRNVLFNIVMNNVGDPFIDGTWGLHSRPFEVFSNVFFLTKRSLGGRS